MRPVCSFIFLLFFSFNSVGGTIYNPEGARSASLGGAGTTLDKVSSVQNVAAFASATKVAVALHYENKFMMSALSLKSFTVVIPTAKLGVFGMHIHHYGFELFNQKKISISYSRTFAKHFNAGLQFNYVSTFISEQRETNNVLSVDAGLQAKITKELSLAAVLINPGRALLSDLESEYIPTLMKVGLAWRFSDKVQIIAEAEKELTTDLKLKGGLEYDVIKQLSLRTGFQNVTSPGSPTDFTIPAFGIGLHFNKFTLDMASSFHPVLGLSSTISMLYEFR